MLEPDSDAATGKGGEHTIAFDEIHDTLCMRRRFVGKAFELDGWRNARCREQVRSADCESAAVDGRACAAAGSHLERLRRRDGNSAAGGHRNNRTRDGMLRIALHRRSKPQRIMVGNAVDGAHRKHAELAKRKCSGLVEHDGIELFTIGQRKGLPGGSAKPRYVVDLDPETNRVIVGDMDDLVVDEFEVDRVNWIGLNRSNQVADVTVKIRYNHPGTAATLTALERGCARIRLHEPQKAVTPGQAAVFYDGDIVLGGGWMCRSATERIRRAERMASVLA